MGRNKAILYSPESVNDLNEIGDYIHNELLNPTAAKNTIDNLLNSVDKLKTFPMSGAPLSSITGTESGYRVLVSGNYLIFYRAEKDAIYIDRVLFGKRDYVRILFDNH